MITPSPTTGNPGYAIAYLREVDLNADIATYLRRIDATLEPYDGRFLVHGGTLTPLEGEWDGDVVVIAFPSAQAARDWYDSPGYQAILGLRTRNSASVAAVAEGCEPGHRGDDAIAALFGE